MISKPIEIAILGLSSFAQRTIIPTLLSNATPFKLSAVASRSAENAKDAGEKFGCDYYTSYDELITNTTANSLYIPLPNSLHFEFIMKGLHANKHILCEKSLGLNYSEVLQMVDLAKSKDLVLMENFQFRFHSQLKKIKELLAEGIIGELRCMRSSFGFPPFPDADNIRYKPELGGGALLDTGAYPIKVTQEFLGRNLEVKAATLNSSENHVVDIWGGAYLKQVDGPLFSEIAFGFDHFYQNSIELWGSKGKLFTNRIFTAHPTISPELIIETNNGREVLTLPADNHFERMLEHFAGLINGTQNKESEYEQNLVQSRLLNQLSVLSK